MNNTTCLKLSKVYVSMFEKIQICDSMARQFAHDHNVRYTCHVRIRPDFHIRDKWVFPVVENTLHTVYTPREINLVINSWMTDQFFYGTPDVMRRVCDLLSVVDTLVCCDCSHIAEPVLTYHVQRLGIIIEKHHLQCDIVLSYRNVHTLVRKLKTGHVCFSEHVFRHAQMFTVGAIVMNLVYQFRSSWVMPNIVNIPSFKRYISECYTGWSPLVKFFRSAGQ